MQRTPPHCGWRFFIPMSAAWDCILLPPFVFPPHAPQRPQPPPPTANRQQGRNENRQGLAYANPTEYAVAYSPTADCRSPTAKGTESPDGKTAARRDATTAERQRIPPRNARPTKDSGTSGHAEFSSIIGRITPFDSFSIGFQRDFDRLSTILSTLLLITPTVISGHSGCGTDSAESAMSAEERTKEEAALNGNVRHRYLPRQQAARKRHKKTA